MDYSERLMRRRRATLPDGEGTFRLLRRRRHRSTNGDKDDQPFWIRCASTEDAATGSSVDFAGTDAQVSGPDERAPLIGHRLRHLTAASRWSADPSDLIPPNSGCWRAIEV